MPYLREILIDNVEIALQRASKSLDGEQMPSPTETPEERASRLLYAHLNWRQRKSLKKSKTFRVRGHSGNIYELGTMDCEENILIVRAKDCGDFEVGEFMCVYIGEFKLPVADHILAQKLMLQDADG